MSDEKYFEGISCEECAQRSCCKKCVIIPGPPGPRGVPGPTGPIGPAGPPGTTIPLNVIYSVNNTLTDVVTATPIPFLANQVLIGSAIIHEPGSPEFILQEAGTYKIIYHTSAFVPANPNLPTALTVPLNLDLSGTVISIAQGTTANQDSYTPISGSAIAQITSPPAVITLVFSIQPPPFFDIQFFASSIIIQKIG